MTTETITIRVDPRLAQLFKNAPSEQQRKLELILNMRLMEALDTTETLEALMSRMSRTAQERGMTPEILEDILNDTDD